MTLIVTMVIDEFVASALSSEAGTADKVLLLTTKISHVDTSEP